MFAVPPTAVVVTGTTTADCPGAMVIGELTCAIPVCDELRYTVTGVGATAGPPEESARLTWSDG